MPNFQRRTGREGLEMHANDFAQAVLAPQQSPLLEHSLESAEMLKISELFVFWI